MEIKPGDFVYTKALAFAGFDMDGKVITKSFKQSYEVLEVLSNTSLLVRLLGELGAKKKVLHLDSIVEIRRV